ncbi:MAG: hypothetical protein ABJQ78_07640 [Alloalcanivorax sp.]
MNTYKKVLPLAVAMALAACGGGSDTVPDQSEGATILGTYPKFNPVTSDLPLNTDLIFADASTSDGTANVGVASNPAEAAVNGLDGFSTNAPFDIAFAGGSIDPGSICTPVQAAMGAECAPNVFLIPLDTSGGNGDALDPGNVVGVLDSALPSTVYTATTVSVDGGSNNVLRVTPQTPLLPETKYLVFVTDGLLNAEGDPVGGSASYQLMGANEPSVPASLAPVRGAVQGWETIAGGVLAMSGLAADPVSAKDAVVISYTFTTSNPVVPMLGMAAPGAALVTTQVEMGFDLPAAVSNLETLSAVAELSKPAAREVGMVTLLPPQGEGLPPTDLGLDLGSLSPQLTAGVASLFTGYIKLPYYLTTPDTTASASYTMDAWQPDQILGAMLSSSLPEGSPSLPPMDVGGSYNVTYRYPFAQRQSTESVPLQLTLPTSEGCGEASPYQTAIYVHGITSDRTSVAGLAHSLAQQCIATVAIDLPLHGVTTDMNSPFYGLNVENTGAEGVGSLLGQLYGENAPAERHFNDPAGSGGQFINLNTLANTRDNLRQSVMDLLNLNASLSAINDQLAPRGVELDVTDVNVVGASLGGIVATTFATVNQLAYAADGALAGQAMNPELASKLNPLSSVAVSVGGSQLAYLLNESQTFGPQISAGLAAAGVTPGTDSFNRFLYVAQSTVDSGDPVNYASILAGEGEMGAQLAGAGLTVPVLLQQVNGDSVVPNGAEALPLVGTQGLSTLMGATQLYPSPNPQAQSPAIVKMVNGAHSSLLSPAAGLSVTNEMQTQVVTFISNGIPGVIVGGGSPADVEVPLLPN